MEKQLLDLVELLKQVAPHVYAIYVRQATNTGIVDLVLSLIMTGGIYGLTRLMSWMHKEVERTKDYDLESVLTIMVMIVLTVASLILFVTGILHILNPEYYAIQAMLGR